MVLSFLGTLRRWRQTWGSSWCIPRSIIPSMLLPELTWHHAGSAQCLAFITSRLDAWLSCRMASWLLAIGAAMNTDATTLSGIFLQLIGAFEWAPLQGLAGAGLGRKIGFALLLQNTGWMSGCQHPA